ncbi:preprotein translocase subunit SecG [Rickettsiales endosymbiont of Stachyamoeba lipophora]|uniref:preprotein translocase subunit SecG n=1 Tax=Rickettsiales endosymbiont of Stachyamoeba lipophora TaxID=2486578 RepID=UPI000F649E47|nr:preprotein translocase subunit SecG [Rickettsiales endosymbiont of Stachyamoeba lipophora]AZL15475.1 preprotein translocase subunit SecG [Rickettsiales endosymbiont of Stachyamoeba lipophora]
MVTLLITVQIVVAVLLVAIVILQKSASEGLGFGSNSNNAILSAQSATNLLSKTTAILAAVFMINSLALSIVMDKKHHANSITSHIEQNQNNKEQNEKAPASVK